MGSPHDSHMTRPQTIQCQKKSTKYRIISPYKEAASAVQLVQLRMDVIRSIVLVQTWTVVATLDLKLTVFEKDLNRHHYKSISYIV